ncbi:MAG: carbohydrate ABC transporter permease [Anaerolineae bacterium]|nr:carbohydrate ABC transporter permease [Anaerolineae bacterium]
MVYGILFILCAFILLPLGWMFTTALRPDNTPTFTIPPEFFPTKYWHWENFSRALTNRNLPFFIFTLNTLKIFALNVIGSVISCTMCAFAFSRMRFRGKKMLFNFLLVTMLIPFAVLMIPTFIMFNKLGWYGTILPLVVPAFFGNAFFIFLITQYMKTIPVALDEAAIIDGANYFQIYWRIILPLSMPVVAVQVVFLFLNTWGDLLGPLIYLTNTSQFTVAIGLASFATRENPNNNLLMAANLIMMIPPLILFFFAQEKLIGGIASVGLKG